MNFTQIYREAFKGDTKKFLDALEKELKHSGMASMGKTETNMKIQEFYLKHGHWPKIVTSTEIKKP